MPADAWQASKTQAYLPGGRRLALADTGGELPVLLLLHGYTDSSRSYALMAPHLRHRYRLIMPDLAGHGDSITAPAPTTELLARDVIQLLDVLGVRECHVAGHSMGSIVALKSAVRDPQRFRSLICISPSLRPRFGLDNPLARAISSFDKVIDPAHPFFDSWYDDAAGLPADFLRFLKAEASGMRPETWRNLYRDMETTDISPHTRAISNPILALFGKNDSLFGKRDRDLFREATPHATITTLDGLGHNPHWAAPQLVASLIDQFIGVR